MPVCPDLAATRSTGQCPRRRGLVAWRNVPPRRPSALRNSTVMERPPTRSQPLSPNTHRAMPIVNHNRFFMAHLDPSKLRTVCLKGANPAFAAGSTEISYHRNVRRVTPASPRGGIFVTLSGGASVERVVGAASQTFLPCKRRRRINGIEGIPKRPRVTRVPRAILATSLLS